MRKCIIILLLMCSGLNAQTGKEAWRWYFGHRCGIDFSSGVPVGIAGIPNYYIQGGCASFSDPITGQYLLSVGGTHIYDRNNAVMNNGYNLDGDIANGQDLIVQQPGHPNIMYVFTPDRARAVGNGVHYSIVDMNMQAGLGSVAVKNKLLIPPPATEKITAVRHCNGIDYWILGHPANSNAFQAFLLTASGLDTVPVISSVGVSHNYVHCANTYCFEGMGVLKASPNGKKVVSAIQSDSLPVMEIFDFDNSSGHVSNPLQFNYPGKFGPYGATFSPDNSKLYCVAYTGNNLQDTSFLYQYNLSSGIPAQIHASETLIQKVGPGVSTGASLGQLQIAPDGKIYILVFYKDTLASINNPNLPGLACGYQYPALILPGGSAGVWGLPNFIDALYAGIQLNIPDLQLCNTFTASTLDAGSGFSAYQWSTGATTQTTTVNAPGQYWVTVTSGQGCQRTDTVNVYVVSPFKKDTMVCDTFKVNATQVGGQNYSWYDSTSNPVKNISQSGHYYVDVTYQSGCTLRDSFNVAVVSSPHVDLGPSSVVCRVNLELNVNYPAVTYTWSTGVTTPSVTLNQPGKYWITIQDTNGCKGSDTINVEPGLLAYTFTMPNIVTPNDDKINDEIDFGKYQFSFFEIEIYNRWGQKLFSSDDPNVVWKPTQEDGTYFYTAKYRIDCWGDAQTKSIKGFITVVR